MAKKGGPDMASEPYSFLDIFNYKYLDNGVEKTLEKIVIPMIQRDYAQGRSGARIAKIRSRFLNSLFDAVNGHPLVLDFVYGGLEDGIMTPLDGQQRLTTLFLLHWYAAAKNGQAGRAFLGKFSYETRESARDFCQRLIAFTPSFDKPISEDIVNQCWFPLSWKKDPTVRSMLTMLDAIDEKFRSVDDLYEKLAGGAIKFYFLPIKDMGLTDELYIKMNSRGKPLTTFEHFKAEFERELKKVDQDLATRMMQKIDGADLATPIIQKIDGAWTDLLWPYRDNNHLIDGAFLCYFKFICDIIRWQPGEATPGKSYDEFDLIDECFSAQNPRILDNIHLLKSYFDCWRRHNPEDFFSSFISKTGIHESGKIKVESPIDLFGDCLNRYGNLNEDTGNRSFPLGRMVLLYACLIYLNSPSVDEGQFKRRIRIVNNLINNSSDELSDRSSGNRMQTILSETKNIILNGEIGKEARPNFNSYQLEEEREKIAWVDLHPDLSEALFELEDHEMLYGQISILGLEHPNLFGRFKELFACQWDLVNQALLTLGDYGQIYGGRRLQLGAKTTRSAWQALFHNSKMQGMENTKKCLVGLLSIDGPITDDVLSRMAADYLAKCEDGHRFDWRYYYIKYPDEFRPDRYGLYYLEQFNDELRYDMEVIYTRRQLSTRSYQPYLAVAAGSKGELASEEYGRCLLKNGKKIYCRNDGFHVFDEDNHEVYFLEIPQENGIDTENRIEILKSYLASLN